MTGQALLAALVILALAWLVLRHHQHLSRYPDLACRTCKGAGRIRSHDWRMRVVSGRCPRCQGRAWYPRRGNW